MNFVSDSFIFLLLNNSKSVTLKVNIVLRQKVCYKKETSLKDKKNKQKKKTLKDKASIDLESFERVLACFVALMLYLNL